MNEPQQGDGSHLAPGSIQAELMRLRNRVHELEVTLGASRAFCRLLVGAIRDGIAPNARAATLSEREAP